MEMEEGRLDADELLHLAIADSRKGAHDEAIKRLKYLVSLAPERADAIFMLAAEHAELGMFDRAADGMRQALAIDPKLHTARMQLGLLYFRTGDLVSARDAWSALQLDLPEDSALRLFPQALLALADNQTDTAIALLERALGDRSNPALAGDIERMLERLHDVTTMATPVPPVAQTPADDGEDIAARQLLANYEKHSRDRDH